MKARPRPKAAVVAPPPVPVQMPAEVQKLSIPIIVEVIHGTKRAESKFKEDEESKAEKTNQE